VDPHASGNTLHCLASASFAYYEEAETKTNLSVKGKLFTWTRAKARKIDRKGVPIEIWK